MSLIEDINAARRAILESTGRPAPVLIVTGALILRERPDLIGEIDPTKAYRVTRTEIVEIED
jgi:hypothetical protein